MALLPARLSENADAVIRQYEMQVHLLSRDRMDIRVKRLITVLNPSGNRHVNAVVGYDTSRKIRHLQARVFDALGNEVETIKERDFRDVSAVDGATLYSDSRIRYLEYTPVHYPYTLEFTYETSSPNTAILPSWYPVDDYRLSVQKSHYKITYASPELRPECMERNLGGFEVQQSNAEGIIAYTATNIEALQEEAMSPAFIKRVPAVKARMLQFEYEGYAGRVGDWQAMGQWIYSHLLKGQDVLPETTRVKAQAMVQGLTDPLEKAKVIYEYVQKNTRYISVQVGIGGIKPVPAMEVDKVKYGDCKGLSNYTRALLQAVGVDAYYCHVEAGKDKVDFYESFADLAQGNHAILAIPDQDGYAWIDCTSQTLPFGFLGDFTDDRRVLMVTPDGGSLVRTPAYLDEQNSLQTQASCTLDPEGSLSGEVSLLSRGIQYDAHLAVESTGREERKRYYASYWPYLNNLKLAASHLENNREAVLFKEEVSLEAANYASRSGTLMLFRPNAFNRFDQIPERHKTRMQPLEVQRGFLDEAHLSIQLPETYRLEALPQTTELHTAFGEYRMEASYDNGSHRLMYKRKLLIRSGVFPKEDYEAYRGFLREIASADNAQVVLLKS